ncbi:MAG: cyclic nucleotide-binding domain-containing protein [Helicobacteraceae bacterium]|nr:cyclic nucleotide-binding domain-containing protein [Candidatus Sulfurimonas ponti]MBL6973216.1 cyclic nucleotide-binding domain-containing protein [Sulfurimonas sp.]
MIQQVEYDIDDIEAFLEVHENSEFNRDSKTLEKLLSVQNKISLIANIDEYELKAMIEKLQFVKYNFKDFIIKEGDISQEIFFILSGECHVFVESKQVGVLKSGTTFGEGAAIFNTKRNASVVCASKEVTVLSFCINSENAEFCSSAMATLYKNLALQINTKLEKMNMDIIKK